MNRNADSLRSVDKSTIMIGGEIMDFLDHGIYTMTEAARLIELHPARIRDWFDGRDKSPVFKADYEASEKLISFLDLIDALVATKLIERGFSVQALRTVYHRLEKNFKCLHPFAHKELLTDGHSIFVRELSETGEEGLIESLNNQRMFPKIMKPFLEKIEYDSVSQLASRWNIDKGIIIDPKLCLGKPVVKNIFVSTRILSREYLANNRNAKLVASWYEVQPKDVTAAFRFEQRLAA
jgi:uncharacterized protein (DUF433 family)